MELAKYLEKVARTVLVDETTGVLFKDDFCRIRLDSYCSLSLLRELEEKEGYNFVGTGVVENEVKN